MDGNSISQTSNLDGESEVEDLLAVVTLPKLTSDLCQRQARRQAYQNRWLKKTRAPKSLKYSLSRIDTNVEEVTDSCDESDEEPTVDNRVANDALSEGDCDRDDS